MFGIRIVRASMIAKLQAAAIVTSGSGSGSGTAATASRVASGVLDQLVAAAKQTSLGATVAAAVKEAESSTDSGPVKLAKVLGIVVPEIVLDAAQGGVTALLGEAETFARQLIESTLADLKQTAPVKIGEALLKVLGVTA